MSLRSLQGIGLTVFIADVRDSLGLSLGIFPDAAALDAG